MNKDEQFTFTDLELQEKQQKVVFFSGELDRKFKEIAYCIGRQKFANIVDLSYSYINEILNTSGNQKPFQVPMIAGLIVEKPDKFKELVIDFLCDLTGYEHPEKKAKLPPEQELKELKKQIKAKGLDVLFKDHF